MPPPSNIPFFFFQDGWTVRPFTHLIGWLVCTGYTIGFIAVGGVGSPGWHHGSLLLYGEGGGLGAGHGTACVQLRFATSFCSFVLYLLLLLPFRSHSAFPEK